MSQSQMGETVTLPRAEYEAMMERLEDLEDQLAIAIAKERNDRLGFAEATRDYLPGPLIIRLLDGESRVRIWREHRGMTAKALAEKAGVNSAYLSEIETRKKPGSFEAMAALAKALEISLDDLAHDAVIHPPPP